MAKIPIALQLYSIRNDCAQDLPGCLKAVARMGYAGVEFAGYYNYSAQDLRKMLDDNGLKAEGTHIGLDTLLGDEFERTVEFNQILGNRFLMVPGLAEERRNSRAAWLETAKIFNGIAERLKPYGMYTGYHNHTIEFAPMDGELPWDTFFGNTIKEVVMQFDTGNAMHGGADPIPFLERYPGRALSVHLKEYSKTNDKALIGEGDIPWQRVFELSESIGGTEWYVVEQESYAFPPMECVERCLDNLRKMGKL
ncbi:MAG TPA: sugar phosphate isomerase/epimerase [Armatimonadota bacterium]|nr:sugar phosphate isomerase/epimerase [Armatimonadota bacterium]